MRFNRPTKRQACIVKATLNSFKVKSTSKSLLSSRQSRTSTRKKSLVPISSQKGPSRHLKRLRHNSTRLTTNSLGTEKARRFYRLRVKKSKSLKSSSSATTKNLSFGTTETTSRSSRRNGTMNHSLSKTLKRSSRRYKTCTLRTSE